MTERTDILEEGKRLLQNAQRGPWQVEMFRDENGATGYRFREHVHGSICVVPDQYWPEGYEPPSDDDGYFQPDHNMDCSESRIETARLLAWVSEHLPMLIEIAERENDK